MSEDSIKRWVKQFEAGNIDTTSLPSCGKQKITKTEYNMQKFGTLINTLPSGHV
jgi:hypothetical protein